MLKKYRILKKNRAILLIGVLSIFLITAAGYTVFISSNLEKEQVIYKETDIYMGDLTLGVSESGVLSFQNKSLTYPLDFSEIISDSSDSGSESDEQAYLQVEKINIAMGQRVQEGDPVITFTKESMDDVLITLENYVLEKKIAYEEAKMEYEIEHLDAANNLEQSEIAESYADDIYELSLEEVSNQIKELELENYSMALQIESLTLQQEDLQETISESYDTYVDWESNLSNVDKTNLLLYVPYKEKFEQAKKQYNQAVEKLSENELQIEEGKELILENQQKIERLTQKLFLAKQNLLQEYEVSINNSSIAVSNYDSTISEIGLNLEETKTDYETAEELLQDYLDFIGDGTLYAAEEGLVVELNYESEDYITDNTTIYSYATEEDKTVTVDVSQEDITGLQVGDQVQITFTAYEDVLYEGIIKSITTTETTEDSNIVSYPVEIVIEGDTSSLYDGMTAEVTFVTERKEQIIYISKKAIIEDGESTYVFSKDDNGEYKKIEVKTGISNGIYIEIVDGLNLEDQVYIATTVSEGSETIDENIKSEVFEE